MKNFTRLLLASAISMSSAAFAMESMDESALAETTGQDGITVDITPNTTNGIASSIVIHDSDGFTGATSAGAIVIGDPLTGGSLVKNSIKLAGAGVIQLLVDATGDIDSGGTTTPAVRVQVKNTTALTIHTGDISVAASAGAGNAVTTTPKKFMNDMTISIGTGTLLNMYLGGESVTGTDAGQHMIEIDTSLTGGLSISNFSLIDAGGTSTGGSIQASSVSMKDVGGAALTIKANADVVATGLLATISQLGSASGANISLSGVKLGDASQTAIGGVDIVGLNMAGTTLKIYGH